MKSKFFPKYLIIVITPIVLLLSFAGKLPGRTLTIEELKRADPKKYVDQSVTVQGIFVRDPLPMLVTNLDIVLANTPMPEDQYIVLSGKMAEDIHPQEYGGAKLRITGIVKLVEGKKPPYATDIQILPTKYELIELIKKYYPVVKEFAVDLTPFFLIKRYAILFSGGINAWNNHIRYWNDLVFMYSTLINKYGFTDNTIFVLYADGTAINTDMNVDYSATQANFIDVLSDISTSGDFIFIFTTNHGGGFNAKDINNPDRGGQIDQNGDEGEESLYENIYNTDFNGDGDNNDQFAWDEVIYSWGGDILDDDWQNVFDNLEYDKTVIVMEQCFSGGLIFDLAQSGKDKIIISAAGQYEFSWAMPPNYNYDEFSYHFTCAINEADPDGNSVNADSNRDGKISIVEAFNFAVQNDSRDETPWYEDNGDGVPQFGTMPALLDEGNLGNNTFIE